MFKSRPRTSLHLLPWLGLVLPLATACSSSEPVAPGGESGTAFQEIVYLVRQHTTTDAAGNVQVHVTDGMGQVMDYRRYVPGARIEVRELEMTFMTRLFDFLASPDIAVLLVMAGLFGLYIEFNSPGLLLPGIAGALCLLLAGIAFQILPFSWVGLLLLFCGIGLMIAEVFVAGFGVLFTAGVVCLLIGGSMLFDVPELSDLTVSFWSVLVPVVAGFATFAALVIYAVGRTLLSRQTAGVGELIGMHGRATSSLAPDGKVFVRGEYWSASADEEIASGEAVEVTAVEGLRLRVRRAGPGH